MLGFWRRSGLFGAVFVLVLGFFAPAAAAANDTHFHLQWALDQIGAPNAWAAGTGAGIKIAIVDTGVHLSHEDLAGKIDSHISCIGSEGDPTKCRGSGQDDNGHGTHVAGIAAAATFNGLGIAGTAPDARIMAVKVLNKDGGGDLGDVRAGIRWAADNGAHVINLSLGPEGSNLLCQILCADTTGIRDEVNYAWQRGAIPVAASGNSDFLFPSGYGSASAVVVTATDNSGSKASYATSVRDADWGLAAPGGRGSEPSTGVLSTWLVKDSPNRTDAYAVASGTSMAAPHVAGAAAVLRGLGLSPQQTVSRLLATASSGSREMGAGRLDLASAVAGLGGSSSPTPDPTPEPTTPEPPPTAEAPPPPTTVPPPPPPSATPVTEPTPEADDPQDPVVQDEAIFSPVELGAPASSNAPLRGLAVAAVLLASATALWGTAASSGLLRREL